MSYSLSKQLPPNDSRQEIWQKQREERGFDNTELWNLDRTIARFIAPRLRVFMEAPHVKADLEYYNDLNTVLKTFELLEKEENYSSEVYEEIHKGIKLFSEIYPTLWY